MSDGYEHDDGYDGYEQDGEPSEADLVCGLLADPAVKAGLGKLVESGLDCPEDAVLAGVAAHLERCLAEYDEMRRRGADPGREWLEAAVKGEHWEASESDPPEPNWRDDPA